MCVDGNFSCPTVISNITHNSHSFSHHRLTAQRFTQCLLYLNTWRVRVRICRTWPNCKPERQQPIHSFNAQNNTIMCLLGARSNDRFAHFRFAHTIYYLLRIHSILEPNPFRRWEYWMSFDAILIGIPSSSNGAAIFTHFSAFHSTPLRWLWRYKRQLSNPIAWNLPPPAHWLTAATQMHLCMICDVYISNTKLLDRPQIKVKY